MISNIVFPYLVGGVTNVGGLKIEKKNQFLLIVNECKYRVSKVTVW